MSLISEADRILSDAILKYRSTFSMPMNFLPAPVAAAPVVPEPMNGSSTVSPSFDHDRI